MRILFLNPGAGLGGAERALLEMVASLHQEFPGCQISVILGDRGVLAEKLRQLQATTLIVQIPKALMVAGDAGAGGPAGTRVSRWGIMLRLIAGAPLIAAYTRHLRTAICAIAPDLIHSNGFKMHLVGTGAAPQRTPVIWHLHDFVSLRPLMPRFLRFNLHRCAAIVATSNSVARDLSSTLVRVPPVHTIYHAVDLNNFRPEGPKLDLDSLSGITPAAPGVVRVGLVATMARWKGHEVFLRALALLRSAPIRGYVIGGPIYRTAGSQYSLDELQRIASKLGLEGRVGFTGFVSDPAAAIRALDVVVHASVAPEPFGLAVAEAFACGRAVVASRSGGVLEIIREDQNALAHRPGDAYELAASLERLVADASFRRMLGVAARQTAEISFTRKRLADDLMRVYMMVTAGSIVSTPVSDRIQTKVTA